MTCQICDDTKCAVSVDKTDVTTVLTALRAQYGRSLSHIAPLSQLAAGVVHELADRLGPGEPCDDKWQPASADSYDYGGPLANYHGIMRLWRAEEIGHYALIGLARAGRLLPRPAETQAEAEAYRRAWGLAP